MADIDPVINVAINRGEPYQGWLSDQAIRLQAADRCLQAAAVEGVASVAMLARCTRAGDLFSKNAAGGVDMRLHKPLTAPRTGALAALADVKSEIGPILWRGILAFTSRKSVEFGLGVLLPRENLAGNAALSAGP